MLIYFGDSSIMEINSRDLLVSEMKMADLKPLITDMNSTVQYRSTVPRVHSKSMHAIYIQGKLYLDMGLRKPKKCVEFDQSY